MKKIVILDDHTLFLQGLEKIIESRNGYVISGTFTNPDHCVDFIRENVPDIFICDLNLDGKVNGLDVILSLSDWLAQTHKIVLTAYNEDFIVEKAKKVGVHAFLIKNTSPEVLFDVLDGGMDNAFFTNVKNKLTAESFTQKEEEFKQRFRLSKKEIEIIRLVVQGKTSQEIADEIFLSKFTVETHRRNILKKLGVSGTTTLQQFAYENNLFG